MNKKNGWLLLVSVVSLAGALPCAAASVTSASFVAGGFAPGVGNTICVGADHPCSSTSGHGSLTAEAGSNPFVVVDATNDYGLLFGVSSGGANITYYFNVTGPGGVVPVIFAYSMTATSFDSSSIADAQLEVQSGILHEISFSNVAGSDSFSDSATLMIAANGDKDMALHVFGRNNAHAYLTTSVTIDPQFLLDNPGYSLQFSSGITNSSPANSETPEPGTVALMGSALVGTVALKRKRRRS